jgi:putative intracellular protease/amidase
VAANEQKYQTYGMLIYPTFEQLDVYGPLNILASTAEYQKIDFHLIAETMDPVTTKPPRPEMNPKNSTVFVTLPPTHTFETAPELDVLIIPGGFGMFETDEVLEKAIQYIKKTAPKVKHILTVCSGSGLAARAGIMDGKKVRNVQFSLPTTSRLRVSRAPD